jgi:Cu(I)/Ag(I) efflux system membrane fusion protein
MKTKTILAVILVAGIAAAAGWFAAQRWSSRSSQGASNTNTSRQGARKILYYQSAMHPWIKSNKPGRCTICGMELVPVYEGEKGFDVAAGTVMLDSNIIQVIHVQTDEIRRRPLQRALRFAGTIQDDDTRHRVISAYVDGRIDRLFVNYVGAEVTKGQPLATSYSQALLTAEREYATILRQQTTATSELQDGLERMAAASRSRLIQLGLNEEQIAALLEKSSTNIHSEILAPMSGTIVSRNVYEGQYVKEGDKLFELADFATMWFLFDAYERDLAWLKPGQKVSVTTPAVPGKTFAGTITFIDPNLKEMTRSAKVRVELPNPLIETNGIQRRELYHKLYADAVVQVEIPKVLAVPRSAVLSPGAGPLVYIEKGIGVYEQRNVRLGRAGDDAYEVLDGLTEGERVVTQGNMLIDAQAQLHATASQGAADLEHGALLTRSSTNASPVSDVTGQSTGSLPPLTEGQRQMAKEFLALADRLTASLAGDNLEEFNTQSRKTHTALPALVAAFEPNSAWRPFIRKIESAGHLSAANDLKAARKIFHPLSEAVVEFTKALRRQDPAFSSLKVFRCPMTKDAFPGAPRTAEWIQLQPQIRNPYFGAEMLDCGSEVK